MILVLQNNSSHSTLNRVKCEKQILPPVEFEPTTYLDKGGVGSKDLGRLNNFV